MKIRASVKAYADFFESITQITPMDEYRRVFDEKVYFEDPFQKVVGVEKVYAVFQHMYATVYAPRFHVNEIVCENNCAYLRWNFSYRRSSKKRVETFTGVSRVEFLACGKVVSHTDYWDSAENIYEKIPVIGFLLRLIKKRVAA